MKLNKFFVIALVFACPILIGMENTSNKLEKRISNTIKISNSKFDHSISCIPYKIIGKYNSDNEITEFSLRRTYERTTSFSLLKTYEENKEKNTNFSVSGIIKKITCDSTLKNLIFEVKNENNIINYVLNKNDCTKFSPNYIVSLEDVAEFTTKSKVPETGPIFIDHLEISTKNIDNIVKYSPNEIFSINHKLWFSRYFVGFKNEENEEFNCSLADESRCPRKMITLPGLPTKIALSTDKEYLIIEIEGREKKYVMNIATYDKVPLFDNLTLEDLMVGETKMVIPNNGFATIDSIEIPQKLRTIDDSDWMEMGEEEEEEDILFLERDEIKKTNETTKKLRQTIY